MYTATGQKPFSPSPFPRDFFLPPLPPARHFVTPPRCLAHQAHPFPHLPVSLILVLMREPREQRKACLVAPSFESQEPATMPNHRLSMAGLCCVRK
jgi:hypothetical protein